MIYALSNSGIDVNIPNQKGNTALHIAYMRGYIEIGFNLIEVNTLLILKFVKLSPFYTSPYHTVPSFGPTI
jgi:hypothetical protein